jgi:predicted transcriptional regulator of viral defense system
MDAPPMRPSTGRPSWDRIYEIAAAQAGYLTRAQAHAAGYSDPLLHHYVGRRRLERTARGLFRLVQFPVSEDEDYVIAWLWSRQEGTFSHETALRLHQLSDVLPSEKHLTMPTSWRRRRVNVPDGIVLHYADLHVGDVAWHGPVRVTSPLRTLLDCEDAAVSPELLEQARRQAVERGLIVASDLRRALARTRGRRRP